MQFSNDASGFVSLAEELPDMILEIRYYSTFNFIGDRIDGYEKPIAIMTREAAAALRHVNDEAIRTGFRLKIWDAYRPQRAVNHFTRWAEDEQDIRMKRFFYPGIAKRAIIPEGYIAPRSGHSRGSTVDLTLFDMAAGQEVDMGGPFDFFGELSHPDYRGITERQFENRMLLREMMCRHGFHPIPEEWWHFMLDEEPYPETYFDFPVSSRRIQNTGREVIW